jgi:preprotein translocase subunit SecD
MMNGTTAVSSGLRAVFFNQVMIRAVAQFLVEKGGWRAGLEPVAGLLLAIGMSVIRHLDSRVESK